MMRQYKDSGKSEEDIFHAVSGKSLLGRIYNSTERKQKQFFLEQQKNKEEEA